MHSGPTKPWSKSNSSSLRQNQGVSFSNLNFAKAPDDALISPFAFEAPKATTTVDLSQLERIPALPGL